MTEDNLVNKTEEIIGLDEDVVLRNLLITQCYHDLAEGLARLLGRENSNWCHFATWASKTAGRFIRKEEVPAIFRELINQPETFADSLEAAKTSLVEVVPESETLQLENLDLFKLAGLIVDHISDVIMAGNLMLFSEVGPLFAAMIHAFEGDAAPDPLKLERFLSPLREGPSDQGGQDILRSALATYHQAFFEKEPQKKAQLVLLANCQIGLHEQTRLQPYIASSLDAPVDVVRDLVHRSLTGELGELDRQAAYWELLLAPLVEPVRLIWEEFSTENLMILALPDDTLRLGRDLPAPRGKALFPKALLQIQLPELQSLFRQFRVGQELAGWRGRVQRFKIWLQALLKVFGFEPSEAAGSESVNWVHLTDRVRYIIQLFRSRQQEITLFDQPFTAKQRRAILKGQVPGGRL